MGAWIEMPVTIGVIILPPVAPHVGAWIEIKAATPVVPEPINVAPHVGAWIEIVRGGKEEVA